MERFIGEGNYRRWEMSLSLIRNTDYYSVYHMEIDAVVDEFLAKFSIELNETDYEVYIQFPNQSKLPRVKIQILNPQILCYLKE
jgi:hypothetical protein